jgi:hypothetical protein
LQVDLFFYRDPEEAKEMEEEAMVAPEYDVVAEYTAPVGDTCGVEWGAGEASPSPAQTGAGWECCFRYFSSFTLIIKILIAWQREFYFGCVTPLLVCLAFLFCAPISVYRL